jgi:hypothetical protein
MNVHENWNIKRTEKFWVCPIAAILLLTIPASAQDDTARVLFIGNSHTYVNNLPSLFANLSLSGGHPVITDMSAPGGYTLQQHTTNQITLDKIALGTWDYVFLQEHSLYPVIDFYRFGSYYPSARILDSLIISLGQRTAIYMTWGRPNGGQWSIGGHYSIDFEDFFQMQDSVSVACGMIAEELSAVLLPAGDAWATARTWDSTVELWDQDNIHATLKGSYLAACVFYAVIFNSSPVGLPYIAGLSPDEALFLQQAADETVLDVAEEPPSQPESFILFQNYPNPFNSGTMLLFEVKFEGPLELAIYNILGERIRTLVDSNKAAGRHCVRWDCADDKGLPVASGTYFAILVQEEDIKSTKLMLIK